MGRPGANQESHGEINPAVNTHSHKGQGMIGPTDSDLQRGGGHFLSMKATIRRSTKLQVTNISNSIVE